MGQWLTNHAPYQALLVSSHNPPRRGPTPQLEFISEANPIPSSEQSPAGTLLYKVLNGTPSSDPC
jgi:hypothetical protein